MPIVGMRFNVSNWETSTVEDHCIINEDLFLVRDINNQYDDEAVMLHNGVKCIGHVSREFANGPNGIYRALKRLSNEIGSEAVFVVNVAGSTMRGQAVIDFGLYAYCAERPARKLAAILKKGA